MTGILEMTDPKYWKHVSRAHNPADCASRGVFPTELVDHELWWEGPKWLKLPPTQWSSQSHVEQVAIPEEEKEISLHTLLGEELLPLFPLDRYSNYLRIKYATAWIFRFIANCRAKTAQIGSYLTSSLSTQELHEAEMYWLSYIQRQHFLTEINTLKSGKKLYRSSILS